MFIIHIYFYNILNSNFSCQRYRCCSTFRTFWWNSNSCPGPWNRGGRAEGFKAAFPLPLDLFFQRWVTQRVQQWGPPRLPISPFVFRSTASIRHLSKLLFPPNSSRSEKPRVWDKSRRGCGVWKSHASIHPEGSIGPYVGKRYLSEF